MKRLALATALGVTLATGAWGQAPPPGTYVFISGPGVGTPPFTVSGFSTSLGGSIGLTHLPNCGGTHVHGTFNGFADPASGGCGHGIIALFVPPPPVSGGSLPGGGLPGGMPNNVAGQLALTTPVGFPASSVGDAFLVAIAGLGLSTRSSGSPGSATYQFAIDVAADIQQPDTSHSLAEQFASATFFLSVLDSQNRGKGLPATALQTTLANPAQRALSSPAATSWLEDFAAYDDRAADGYRRDAEKTAQQADAWRELADDARRDAERNHQRADDARRDGRDADAKDWDAESQRDEESARERDAEAQRLDGWSDEARQRETSAREQARERREAAERAREQARQAERDRAERARQQAEERARVAREEREARRAKEAAEREARIRELQDRVRAREAEAARQRAAAEREHRAWLAEQEARRNARARGGSTDADAFARKKKKEEEEEKTWADYVVEYADSAADWVKDKLTDKVKDEVMDRTGITGKIDDLGLDKATGALGEGIDQLKAVKKLGDSMEAELQRQPGLRRRIESRIDALTDQRTTSRETLTSGSLYGKEMFGTVSRMVEANH